MDFDGIDDNVNFSNTYNLNSGSFSIETWIKPGVANGNIHTIFSKRNSVALSDGYDLRLENNIISFNWNNGNSIASNFSVSTGRWYHVVVTFDGTSYRLYIDGVIVHAAVAGSNPTSNGSAKCILGAMIQSAVYPYLPTNFYNGWMQELRIWNVALTEAQTHQMMNQKIENNSTNVYGSIVPLTIPGLAWTNLAGYYQMVQPSDIVNGYLTDKTANAHNGRLIGIITAQPETAPLPYTSVANGTWETSATWTHGNVWSIPDTKGIDNTTFVDWNIVKTSNNITTAGNKTVLGLLVISNKLDANNNNKIEISHYLKLDGEIDLEGMSQLLQTAESILDVTSSGFVERDQQGQSNLFNYNYWSSPVSPINSAANNTNYTVTGVLKDGAIEGSPLDINWVAGYDGANTYPMTIARYWLYKFDNYVNEYANWSKILETDPLRVGQGFTMKGCELLSASNNYTFIGKPNNGTITTNTVSTDQLLLTGNPYPSALDAQAFINDNIGSIDGTLYFWEHYLTNDSHILREYEGGHAVENLVGGIAPSSIGIDYISQLGTPSKGIPYRYIPVGQGFFVNGSATGGTVIFNNAQRGFQKETNVGVSNPMYKIAAIKSTSWKNNDNDPIVKDTIMRIRLGFISHNDSHRQVLLGFMNDKASSGMDNGYDALNIDDLPNDMYLLNGENQLVITGEGFFDASASFPIGVKADSAGMVSFTIDAIENFDPQQAIFLYDDLNKTYNTILGQKYEVNLPAGYNDTRFSLRFTDKTLGVENNNTTDKTIKIAYIQKRNILIINNPQVDNTVEKVSLYSISGQLVASWKIENQEQQNIQLPVKSISSGIYIAKLKTTKGDFSKKIIVN